jgi:hypothetical protein
MIAVIESFSAGECADARMSSGGSLISCSAWHEAAAEASHWPMGNPGSARPRCRAVGEAATLGFSLATRPACGRCHGRSKRRPVAWALARSWSGEPDAEDLFDVLEQAESAGHPSANRLGTS